MKVPFVTPVELETPLDAREVYVRLRDAIPSKFFASRSESPVTGTVSPGECRLRARTFYNNSFQRRLHLSFVQRPTGTKLIGEFRLTAWVVLFMIFWFGFLGVFNVVWLLGWVQTAFHRLSANPDGGVFSDTPWPWALQPFGMMLFGFLLLRFGVWVSRLTEPDAIELVEKTLSAAPRERSPRQDHDLAASTAEGEVLIRPKHEEPEG